MPKSRYGIMTPYMDKVGTLGTSMMYRSCTVQANLDFSDEADMVKKLRVSLALQPIVTALFANSPFVDGKPSGYLSFRSHIWLNTDDARTGMLPFAFEDGFGFERYADYALDVPMYFVIRDKQYVNVAGESFRAFLEGELPQLPGEKPTIKDWEDHLSTLFPEVRLKQFLEMRGADMGDEAQSMRSGFWVGLLYDERRARRGLGARQDWTVEEMATLRNDVPRTRSTPSSAAARVADIATRGRGDRPARASQASRARRGAVPRPARGNARPRTRPRPSAGSTSTMASGPAISAASSTQPRSRSYFVCAASVRAPSHEPSTTSTTASTDPIQTIGLLKSPRNTARSASTMCLNGLKSETICSQRGAMRHRQQDAREQQDRQRQRIDQRRERVLALGCDARWRWR